MSTTNNDTPAVAAAPAAPPSRKPPTDSTEQQSQQQSASHRDGRSGRGGRGQGASRGRGVNTNGKRNKNMGRNEYNRHQDDNGRKRPRTDWKPLEGVDDADREERKPKRKVAVMISYCGSGYKGMQLNPPFKSIEGDLFEAFVQAGAISRANSDDPKKSSFVRCARTDKGVHAAGNVVSLKLIVEDPEIVPKINAALPEQIRVWDIIRTTGSFSCYQLCDSRKYEYLVPSHVFLPPHPGSFLAKACLKYAKQEDDLEGYLSRQKEVEDWWTTVNDKVIQQLGDEARPVIEKVMAEEEKPVDKQEDTEPNEAIEGEKDGEKDGEDSLARKVREIYMQEKRAYRISPERLERVREAFRQFVGTNNYYNFTIDKTFKDPSAKRHIRSFEVNDPFVISSTEWLSIHVHGQSFMMHQIRKMVGLAMMVVRSGCVPSRITEAFGPRKIAVGKAPALGLLLEHPLFTHYNEKISKGFDREPLDFEKYKDDIDAFKQKFIYSKIYDQEERENTFTAFVQYLDCYRSPTYLYLTSAGFKVLDEAAAKSGGKLPAPKEEPDNESDEETMIGTEEG
ncbi:tRNA pseudouridine synthase [Tricharina praecox]|uniref:tRNA pseudouridine synthase n=1 Tax=Tricharina praecox TaxID=43433 RepID=UPI00221F789D|nr:tRNA pseudouridine synthase [Tricharina praecox]KAI5853858.1 tRNA pseudouridine synthase [Tricharina praecox]